MSTTTTTTAADITLRLTQAPTPAQAAVQIALILEEWLDQPEPRRGGGPVERGPRLFRRSER